MYDISQSIEPICIHCGQCVNLCSVESIYEKFDYLNLKRQLKDSSKVKMVSIAHAVRVAIGEEFGIPHTNLAAKLVTALKRLGFDYVFDIMFGADLTIMEEASELVHRIQSQERLPLFTSCCHYGILFLW